MSEAETHEEAQGQLAGDEQLDAEAQARRRLALAQIRQYPDPVLRMRAREVDTFDDVLQGLIRRLRQLMHDANGVGLAATQVGILQRVFVFQQDEETHAIVNPVITERSEELEVGDEGCLSLQGVLVPVERHVSLTLEGRKALTRLRAIVTRVDDEFLAPLDADERATLHQLLLKLAAAHDERYAPNGSA